MIIKNKSAKIFYIFPIVFFLCLCLAILTKPEKIDISEGYEEVMVLVINVEKEEISTQHFNRTIQYYVTIECEGAKYRLGPWSSAAYQTGGTYTMYRVGNHFYRTKQDLDSSATMANAPIPFRIGCIGAFGFLIATVASTGSFFKGQTKLDLAQMQIHGSLDYIIFDMGSGYSIKAYGELRPGAKFIVYKSSLKHWQEPHEKENLTNKQIAALIQEVESRQGPGKVQITFE